MQSNTIVRRFDAQMYAAALVYYGLPTDYKHTFKQKLLFDRQTNEPILEKNGKQKTTLVFGPAGKESNQGNAVWIQVNRPFADKALTGNDESQYRYPKKAKNEEIQWIANVTLDFEYPPDPHIAHRVGNALAIHLVEQGLAEKGLPVEDSRGGCHIVLPLPAIETQPETAELWNSAVYEVVKTHIQPTFDRLVKQAGIKMDLGGYDISRVLSAPGTWRPYRPDKKDCDELKEGSLRRWLAPYVDDHYPARKECAKLAILIRDTYERLKQEAVTKSKKAPKTKPTADKAPETWLTDYADRHPASGDRSTHFHTLVCATYRRYDEETVRALQDQINELSENKYNGRLDEEIARSLASIKSQPVKPEVTVGGQLPEMVQAALDALLQVERDNPTIFVKMNQLVKVAADKKRQTPIIHPMGTSELKNALARAANFYRLKEKSGDYVKVPIVPSKDIVEAIASPEDPSELPFPLLDAIVSVPVMRPDGTIIDTPGYDPSTRLYYKPTPDLVNCRIPLAPTQEDARQACAKIAHIIAEFPFTQQSDRANAMGAILTPFIRHAIDENDFVPLGVFDAAGPGTGKTKLVRIISILSTGCTAVSIPAQESEEEWDKKILTELMEGNTFILIDNIPDGVLKSAKLETVLTNLFYGGRILGQSKSAKPENHAAWFATGNNLKLAGDLPERCYWVRMVSPVSDPDTREFEIEDLEKHVYEHRCELVKAILTMIRAWQIAGKPLDTTIKKFRDFTSWAKTIGSILTFAGVEGFLTDRIARKDEIDTDRNQWTDFLRAWRELFTDTPVTIKQVKEKFFVGNAGGDAGGDNFSDFYYSLPADIQELYSDNPKNFSVAFSKALQARIQRRYGSENFHIEKGAKTRQNVGTWIVFAGDAGDDSLPTHGKNEIKKEKNIFSNGSKNDRENKANNLLQPPACDTDDKTKNDAKRPVEPTQPNSTPAEGAGGQNTPPAPLKKNNDNDIYTNTLTALVARLDTLVSTDELMLLKIAGGEKKEVRYSHYRHQILQMAQTDIHAAIQSVRAKVALYANREEEQGRA